MESINERAMLVDLRICQWSANKTDKKITREVAAAHGSEEGMGRYNKSLIAKSAIEEVKKIAGEARTDHYFRTLPWADDGPRILSAAGYFDYAASMRDKETRFKTAVEAVLTNYDAMKQDARARLNGLYNEADYPTLRQLERKYQFSYNVLPVPTADDFRVDLGNVETARIAADIESRQKLGLESAMRDVWQRLYAVVQKMSERLHAYNPAKPQEAPFRDTLTGNIQDLLDVLPTLNLTSDTQLSSVADTIKRDLLAFPADTLREVDHARIQTADAADQIMQAMEQFI